MIPELRQRIEAFQRDFFPKVPKEVVDTLWELPVPGTFVVARDGTIRLAYVDADYTKRLEPAEMVASLRAIA